MNTRSGKPINRTIVFGMILLPVANATAWLLQRHTAMLEGPRDSLSGVVFGIAIGVMISGLGRARHNSGRT
jgi:hypothetical protein